MTAVGNEWVVSDERASHKEVSGNRRGVGNTLQSPQSITLGRLNASNDGPCESLPCAARNGQVIGIHAQKLGGIRAGGQGRRAKVTTRNVKTVVEPDMVRQTASLFVDNNQGGSIAVGADGNARNGVTRSARA